MELINCIIKEAKGEYRAKRKDFLSSHALVDFRKCPELFRKKERCVGNTSLDFAATENAAAIERLKKCRSEKVWPTGYEEVRIMESI